MRLQPFLAAILAAQTIPAHAQRAVLEFGAMNGSFGSIAVQQGQDFRTQVLAVLFIGGAGDMLGAGGSLVAPEALKEPRAASLAAALRDFRQALAKDDKEGIVSTVARLAKELDLTPDQAKALLERYLNRPESASELSSFIEALPAADLLLLDSPSYGLLDDLSRLETASQFAGGFDGALNGTGSLWDGPVTEGQRRLHADVATRDRTAPIRIAIDGFVPELGPEQPQEVGEALKARELALESLVRTGLPFVSSWGAIELYRVRDRRLREERALSTDALLVRLGKGARSGSAVELYRDQLREIRALRGRDARAYEKRLAEWQERVDANLPGLDLELLKEEGALQSDLAGMMIAAQKAAQAMENDAAVQAALKAKPEAAALLATLADDPAGAKLTEGQRQDLAGLLKDLSDVKAFQAFEAAQKGAELAGQKLDEFLAKNPELKAYRERLAAYQAFNKQALAEGRVPAGRTFSPFELGMDLPRGTAIQVAREQGRLGVWILPDGMSKEGAWFRSTDGRLVIRRGRDKEGKLDVLLVQEFDAEGRPVSETLTDLKGKLLIKTTFRKDGGRTIEDLLKNVVTTLGPGEGAEVTVEDRAKGITFTGSIKDGELDVKDARLTGSRHKPILGKDGKLLGFNLDVVHGGYPDLQALVKAGHLNEQQRLEMMDVLSRHFQTGILGGDLTALMFGPDGKPMLYHEDKDPGGVVHRHTIFYKDGALMYQWNYVNRNGTYDTIHIYNAYSSNGRGGGEHWASQEVYKTRDMQRYSVERDWHFSQEFAYGKYRWNGKDWELTESKVPQDDGRFDWVTKRIAWTFSNVPVYKQVGATVNFVADRGKDFGYLISGYTGKLIGATGSVDHKVYGIVTKWQAPVLANSDGAGLALMAELKASLGEQVYNDFLSSWREMYREAMFKGSSDIRTALAVKDNKVDITEEDIGRFLISGQGEEGFGGAGKAFSRRAANSNTFWGAAGNYTGAALVYAGDFTFQSLGFNAVGRLATWSSGLAKGTAAFSKARFVNGVVQTARFTQDTYFMSLMGVQALELGDALSKGDREKTMDALTQITGLLLMPGGDQSRGAKGKWYHVSFKNMAREMGTTNMLAGSLGKLRDLTSAARSEGFKGAAAELGYNPYAKTGKLYLGASQLLVDQAREAGAKDPALAKELAVAALALDKLPAERLIELSEKVRARDPKKDSSASDAADALVAEANAKVRLEVSETLRKAGVEQKVIDEVLSGEPVKDPAWLKSLRENPADTLVDAQHVQNGTAEGAAKYRTKGGKMTAQPVAMEVRVDGAKIVLKQKGKGNKDFGRIERNGQGFELRRPGRKSQPGRWELADGKWEFRTADGGFRLTMPEQGKVPAGGHLIDGLNGLLLQGGLGAKNFYVLPNGVLLIEMPGTALGFKTFFPESWNAGSVSKAVEAVLKDGKVMNVQEGRVRMRGTYEGVTVDVWVGQNGKIETAYPAPLGEFQARRTLRRLVIGGGRAEGMPRPKDGDVAINIDMADGPHVQADAYRLPFKDQALPEVYFEAVPFTAFTGEKIAALKEAARVLKEGGRLVIDTGRAAPEAEIVAALEAAGLKVVEHGLAGGSRPGSKYLRVVAEKTASEAPKTLPPQVPLKLAPGAERMQKMVKDLLRSLGLTNGRGSVGKKAEKALELSLAEEKKAADTPVQPEKPVSRPETETRTEPGVEKSAENLKEDLQAAEKEMHWEPGEFDLAVNKKDPAAIQRRMEQEARVKAKIAEIAGKMKESELFEAMGLDNQERIIEGKDPLPNHERGNDFAAQEWLKRKVSERTRDQVVREWGERRRVETPADKTPAVKEEATAPKERLAPLEERTLKDRLRKLFERGLERLGLAERVRPESAPKERLPRVERKPGRRFRSRGFVPPRALAPLQSEDEEEPVKILEPVDQRVEGDETDDRPAKDKPRKDAPDRRTRKEQEDQTLELRTPETDGGGWDGSGSGGSGKSAGSGGEAGAAEPKSPPSASPNMGGGDGGGSAGGKASGGESAPADGQSADASDVPSVSPAPAPVPIIPGSATAPKPARKTPADPARSPERASAGPQQAFDGAPRRPEAEPEASALGGPAALHSFWTRAAGDEIPRLTLQRREVTVKTPGRKAKVPRKQAGVQAMAASPAQAGSPAIDWPERENRLDLPQVAYPEGHGAQEDGFGGMRLGALAFIGLALGGIYRKSKGS